MACKHKFIEYLNLGRINFEPNTLIVGTFNPAWPSTNTAEWFYGRTSRNYFWDALPRLYNSNLNLRTQSVVQWKEFCRTNSIAITDIITSIKDAEEANEEHQGILHSYLDTSIADYFDDFQFTDLVELVKVTPTIQFVYLTRQAGVELFDNRWNLLEEYALENPNRNLRLRKLMTPSASARFQIRDYKLANPNDRTPLRNFIFQSWQEQWHF